MSEYPWSKRLGLQGPVVLVGLYFCINCVSTHLTTSALNLCGYTTKNNGTKNNIFLIYDGSIFPLFSKASFFRSFHCFVNVPRTSVVPKKDIPEIKIFKQSIVLNKNARNIIQADKLELAYDTDGKIIRIKKAEQGGIFLKKTKVLAKGFLEHFDIEEKGKFPTEYKDNEQTLYVKEK